MIGLPYGMLVQDGSTSPIGWNSDQQIVSVGPPEPTTWIFGLCARSRSGRVSGIQSPESTDSRSDSSGRPPPRRSRTSASPTSSSIRTGTEFHSVTRSACTRPAQTSGSACSNGGGTTTVPPCVSTPKTS